MVSAQYKYCDVDLKFEAPRSVRIGQGRKPGEVGSLQLVRVRPSHSVLFTGAGAWSGEMSPSVPYVDACQ